MVFYLEIWPISLYSLNREFLFGVMFLVQKTHVWIRKSHLGDASNTRCSFVLEIQHWLDTSLVSVAIHHPNMPMMKCFFWQNVWSMLQIFGISWNMVHVSVPSSPNIKQRAWRWWYFLLVHVCQCLSDSEAEQVMQTTRIIAFDIPSTETVCLNHIVCIAQQHCCYILTE